VSGENTQDKRRLAVRFIRWFAGVSYEQGNAKRRIANMSGEWIAVTERLPERNEKVLVIDEAGVNVGSYSPMLDDWWSLHNDRMAPGPAVTHWMPLPAPPTDAK
jgi:hypothetical protein